MKLGSSPEIKLSDALKLAQDDALDAKGKLFSMFLMKNPEYLKMTKEHSIGKSSLYDRRKFAEFYNKLYGETDENEYLDDQFKRSFPFYGKADTKDEKFMSWLKGRYNGGREFAEDVAPRKGTMSEARDDKKKYLQSALEKFLQMPLDNLDDEHKKQVADRMGDFVKQLMDNDPGFVRQYYDAFFKGRLDKNQTATMEDVSDFINDLYNKHGMTFFSEGNYDDFSDEDKHKRELKAARTPKLLSMGVDESILDGLSEDEASDLLSRVIVNPDYESSTHPEEFLKWKDVLLAQKNITNTLADL